MIEYSNFRKGTLFLMRRKYLNGGIFPVAGQPNILGRLGVIAQVGVLGQREHLSPVRMTGLIQFLKRNGCT